jgi:hypothetical protein
VDFKGNALTYGTGTWSSPDNIDPGVSLESISCVSATSCIAVDGTSMFRWLRPTATAITAVSRRPVAGRPVAVRVQVRGLNTTARSATPTGKVTVTDGRRNCQAVLSGSDGAATGTCSITGEKVGRYFLKARYPGDAIFGSSSTRRSTLLKVNRATSRTALETMTTRESTAGFTH